MRREDETMKETKAMNSILVGLLLMVAVEAQAVDYKSTYKGSRVQPTVGVATTVTAPTVGFQSTSAYSGQWAPQESTTPMLNSDGTVNDGAYMGSPKRPGIRRTDTNINNPGDPDDKEDDGNTPLGDGLWVLLLLAVGYAGARVARKRTYTDK